MSDYIAEHKVPPFELVEMTNADPGFYDLVGPWLSKREVIAELGAPVWDDPDRHWIIAKNDADGLIGMVAERKGMVCSLYVVPGARGQVVGTTMVLRIILRHGSAPLRAMATSASRGLFESCGFQKVKSHGKYHVMVRQP